VRKWKTLFRGGSDGDEQLTAVVLFATGVVLLALVSAQIGSDER
jgi:hypothetical protein